VSDAAVALLAQRCFALESLSLYECPRCGDAALEHLARARPRRLRWLSVPKCDGVTRAGLAALLRAAPALVRVSCSLAEDDAHQLRATFPRVRVEEVGD